MHDRRAPKHGLSHLDELRRRPRLALFLDYDGTLTPIVDDPAAALLSERMRAAVAKAASTMTVAVVSGRDRADVERRVGLSELCYAGSHGFDIRCPERAHVHPEAEAAVPRLDGAEARIARDLSEVPGVLLERKRFSLAVHHRRVPEAQRPKAIEVVEEAARESGLRVQTGKQVHDLVPDVDWDKGRAVLWLLSALGLGDEVTPVYLGDDDTDVHAFRAIAGRGVSVGVGDGSAARAADYRLSEPAEVERFLEGLTS